MAYSEICMTRMIFFPTLIYNNRPQFAFLFGMAAKKIRRNTSAVHWSTIRDIIEPRGYQHRWSLANREIRASGLADDVGLSTIVSQGGTIWAVLNRFVNFENLSAEILNCLM